MVPVVELELEVDGGGLLGPEVELLRKGRVEPLAKPLLVQIEGLLEGAGRAREDRRPREDDACADTVGGFRMLDIGAPDCGGVVGGRRGEACGDGEDVG